MNQDAMHDLMFTDLRIARVRDFRRHLVRWKRTYGGALLVTPTAYVQVRHCHLVWRKRSIIFSSVLKYASPSMLACS